MLVSAMRLAGLSIKRRHSTNTLLRAAGCRSRVRWDECSRHFRGLSLRSAALIRFQVPHRKCAIQVFGAWFTSTCTCKSIKQSRCCRIFCVIICSRRVLRLKKKQRTGCQCCLRICMQGIIGGVTHFAPAVLLSQSIDILFWTLYANDIKFPQWLLLYF